MNQNPEQLARDKIDSELIRSGAAGLFNLNQKVTQRRCHEILQLGTKQGIKLTECINSEKIIYQNGFVSITYSQTHFEPEVPASIGWNPERHTPWCLSPSLPPGLKKAGLPKR